MLGELLADSYRNQEAAAGGAGSTGTWQAEAWRMAPVDRDSLGTCWLVATTLSRVRSLGYRHMLHQAGLHLALSSSCPALHQATFPIGFSGNEFKSQLLTSVSSVSLPCKPRCPSCLSKSPDVRRPQQAANSPLIIALGQGGLFPNLGEPAVCCGSSSTSTTLLTVSLPGANVTPESHKHGQASYLPPAVRRASGAAAQR